MTYSPEKLPSRVSRLTLMTALISAAAGSMILMSCSPPPGAEAEAEVQTEEAKPVQEAIKLPGIKIDTENQLVDVAAEVCLDQGLLELVACTKGTREHEAVVILEAEPIHIHTALLLIGARNGNPAMSKPINEEKTRWMHLPAQGDPINVSLVIESEEGQPAERPISDFITRTKGDPYMSDMGYDESEPEDDEKEETFPHTFLFAGSHLIENEEGEKQYLAEVSGNVITISTFGDEILCLPDFQSRENGELVWEIDPTHLPPVGTKVTLRLRLAAGTPDNEF